jgi:dihydroorotate dehydrogenase
MTNPHPSSGTPTRICALATKATFYERVLRPLAFKLDPEWVHYRAMDLLSRGLIRSEIIEDPRLAVTAAGLKFANPMGLAAGFDKNAVAVSQWHRVGFGHAELGTVTRHAQPGNPRPRLFRLPADRAILNRMGFNNDGADAMATHLEQKGAAIPIGINLGKSKITELADAASDYAYSYRRLQSFGDYFVVNVSSPNTPGLRGLQEKGPLGEIFAAINEIDSTRPLFVKTAPDLTFPALDDVIEVALAHGLKGMILTNTTLSREGLATRIDEAGGISGRPVFELSNQHLAYAFRSVPADFALIGVGGVFDGEDVYRKIRLGANLTQVYTGWIYGGPGMVPRSLRQLLALMARDGVKSLAEIRGVDA